jgi:hypothetical protein
MVWDIEMLSGLLSKKKSMSLQKQSEAETKNLDLYVDLYNWVINHGSLRVDKVNRTPAMAAGLIDHQMSYQEYIWLPVYTDYKWRERLAEKVVMMNKEEVLRASRRLKIKPHKAIVMGSGELAA